ncbi:hypothetical protein SAMD00079811_82720 (plasmid) [Scytonema sp. HK-05]|jgi:hypothetical protein|uniref:hypothetical protein n=1 Tax=Scytonema sp. HK-05 TaxID=1137095 RepID=UPI00093678C6|nr:hypothetical protein [Scytonema sp. HK-05]OKH43999.1 hypothetical protein NIES2130_38320 [Scytonema sp. HK-05]BAY50643.1 hypothetical protein SAMD00079811_82720 [Scytonema sp. HK-05]
MSHKQLCCTVVAAVDEQLQIMAFQDLSGIVCDLSEQRTDANFNTIQRLAHYCRSHTPELLGFQSENLSY